MKIEEVSIGLKVIPEIGTLAYQFMLIREVEYLIVMSDYDASFLLIIDDEYFDDCVLCECDFFEPFQVT